MKRTKLLSALSTVALAGALAVSLGSAAQADNDHGRGHGHDYKHGRVADRDGHWDHDRGHRNWHRGCPPGLVAAHGRCYPPGQFKKVYRDHDRYDHDRYVWRRGERLRDGHYRVIDNWGYYHLPRPPYGERYVIVNNNQVLRVNSNTLAVLGEVGLLSALLNN